MAVCGLNPLQYVKEVAKCIVTEVLWPPIKLHVNYWWCFDGNVQGLRDEISSLERERRNMDRKIEESRLRAESATTEFKDWSDEGTRKIEEATRILQGCNDLKVWNIIPRYSVGKSAKETAESIAKLRNELISIVIADPPPPAAMASIPHASTLEFQSRRGMEEDIMKSLKDGNVRMIAICGAGGIGKTTMAKRIEDRVKNEKLFEEVVFVVVSQPIDMLKIQKQIAEILGYGLREDTLAGRAHVLRTRLKDPKKKLIIFDDVWECFDPNDIGVPYRGCKTILTSRLEDVCVQMVAEKVIKIEVLAKIEAWTLFREQSGDCVDASDLRPVAEDVVAECKGLPIALVTIGRALKKKNIKIWKDALSQLRIANPANFPEVLEDVYRPLKLSYDFLKTKSEKDLFLLCCLFPEDYNIWIEDLALLSFGLGLFEGINSIEDGRNRTHHLIERLKSRFLLMTGEDDETVKMHDVVRDVAIFIGSKEKQGFLRSLGVDLFSKDSSRNCNWMSVDISNIANAKLPIRLDFPNLSLLMILNSSNRKFPEGFDVDGMEELSVFYFSNQNLQSLPSSLKFLKKLRKLHLEECEVKDISVVGELASLEILRLWGCRRIRELPADIGRLKFLRLLELTDCEKLERIVAGVISSLVGLEELKIVGCFHRWEGKGNLSEERNASLWEIESLRNLTSLEIDISDANLLFAEEIYLNLQQLERYQIRHVTSSGSSFFGYHYMKYERKIQLCLRRRDLKVGNWIRQLVKRTQSLALTGDDVIDCKFSVLGLEEIFDCRIPEESNFFQHLESLQVLELHRLGYLWKSHNQNVNLLKHIHITECTSLRYLFPMVVIKSLVQLQTLRIKSCDTMEQVFWNEMEINTEASIIEFPKLEILSLQYLPKLAALTQGVEIIKSPLLRKIVIRKCPKLRTRIGIEFSNDNGSSRCMIQKLCVNGSDTTEEIFWNETLDDHCGERHIIFPELYELELRDLPRLTAFYRGTVESISFPKLRRITIRNLKSFSAIDSEHTEDQHSLHFFCNQKVEIDGLEDLYLFEFPDRISQMWCRHIPISLFHNLTDLYISNIGGIRNSISSSIAKALVNLNWLRIQYCKQLVDVIEDETHAPLNSVFPSLKSLHIVDNVKLRSFCQWKHAFELPSLEIVEIIRCPLMETFTLGSLSTPELRQFVNDFENIKMTDLNGGIHHFIAKIVNEDEYKDDCSVDEKERIFLRGYE